MFVLGSLLLAASASLAQEITTTTTLVSLSPTEVTLLTQAKSLAPPPLTIVLSPESDSSAQATFTAAGVDVSAMAQNAASIYDIEKVRYDLDKLAKTSAASGKKSRADIENLSKKVLDKRTKWMDEAIKSKTWAVEDRATKMKFIDDEIAKVKSLPLIGFNGLYPNTKLLPELAGSKAYATCAEIQAYADKLAQKKNEHTVANKTDLYEIQKTMKEREVMFATAADYVQKYSDSIASMMPKVQ
jgi:hypothetical protein